MNKTSSVLLFMEAMKGPLIFLRKFSENPCFAGKNGRSVRSIYGGKEKQQA